MMITTTQTQQAGRKSSALRLLILISVVSFMAGLAGGVAVTKSTSSCQLMVGGQTFSIR